MRVLEMSAASLKRWSREEYYAMLDRGILSEDDRVELVNGQIIQMSPQKPPHAASVNRTADYFKSLLNGLVYVRVQSPVVLKNDSEPEPDIAVVQIDEREYSDRHPATADIFLIIEISDSTLEFELGEKATSYARSGITDYWVVDVRHRQIHVLRCPIDGIYIQHRILTSIDANCVCSPLAFPDIDIYLLSLLPL